jgi:LysM repeat protein
MDNNDSNIKSQQTGGLKLMTVFIAVLALHVVVIGGFTVYHLMSGGSADADLATTDKTHKDLKGIDGTVITDGAMPDASQGEKSAPTTTTSPAEVATIPQTATVPAATPAPEQDAATPAASPTVATTSTPAPAPAVTSVPAPAPALTPALTLTAPAPLAPPAPLTMQSSQTPTGPISSSLAPPPDVAPSLTAPLAAGPVHMPAMTSASAAAKATAKADHEREHGTMYTVKITDSYKKIAQAHHITVAELKEANHIKGNTLHTGQKLVIPSDRKFVAESATSATSTLASAPATPVLGESAAPMTTSLASTTTTEAAPALHHHLYTIVKGDTLTKIAHKFKTTPSAIMAENGITDPAKLSIGKKLKIPSRESRSAENAAPASTQPSQVQAKPTVTNGQLANFTP